MGIRSGLNRSTFALLTALAVLVGVVRGESAQAQCQDWREGGSLPGLLTSALTSTLWDPDGPGPRSPQLIVGGEITAAGNVAANNIAAWDGTSWQPLGTGASNGINGPVHGLTVFRGQLIAGGRFTQAGGQTANNLAVWNGTSWQPLPSEVSGGFVLATIVFNDRLIAGGTFTHAGGQPANGIAEWDGISWRPLGTGISGSGSSFVYTLKVFEQRLISGGLFTVAGGQQANNVAAWSEASGWEPLGSGAINGVNGEVRGLGVFNNRLVAGGVFTQAGGQAANRVAEWNGTAWRPLGNGVGDGGVNAFEVFGGRLFVGGGFTQAGGQPANNIAVWNESTATWSSLGTGSENGVGGGIYTFTVFNGELVALGGFLSAGGRTANAIAAWNGASWRTLGSGDSNGATFSVNALTSFDGRLAVGGAFSQAGGVPAKFVADWDGTSWRSLGTGDANGTDGTVAASTVYSNGLIVGGGFTKAGGQTANRVARWDGSSWSPLGNGFGNGAVYALATFNSQLVAGGSFNLAGGQTMNAISRWNGGSWQPVGPGTSNGLIGAVYAFTVHNQRLIVGGDFAQAGGQAASCVVAWDGTSWHPLGTGVSGSGTRYASALTVFGGRLIAGGIFTSADGQPANNIAEWDGTSWRPLGSGVNGEVRALTVHNGRLIVGGLFSQAGGQSADRIAEWDGSVWRPLGIGFTGVGTSVLALSGFDPDGAGSRPPVLTIGGDFGAAGGRGSPNFAIWGPPSDSVWSGDPNTPGSSGTFANAANWACSVLPDATQTIVIDRTRANQLTGVNLDTVYQLNLAAPLTARRIIANSDIVTINLDGKPLTLSVGPSIFRPGIIVGDRAGPENRLFLTSGSGGPAVTLDAGGVNVGRAAGSASRLSVDSTGMTLRVRGPVIVGDAGQGTLNIGTGATLLYGDDPAVTGAGPGILALGLAPCTLAGTTPCASLNVLNTGTLASFVPGSQATVTEVVSIAGAADARAAVSLTGPTALWDARQNNFFLGDLGRGTLSISGGAQLLSRTQNQVVLARLPGSSASVSIRGAGSRWVESLTGLTVGTAGPVTINVADGGRLQAPTFFNLPAATVTGNGEITSFMFNLGTLAPGDANNPTQPATLTINGNLLQIGADPSSGRLESGVVSVDIAGRSAGQYDRLAVSGTTELAGGLFVRLASGFTPQPTDSIPVLTSDGPIDGRFDVALFPGIGNGRFLKPSYPAARGPGGRGPGGVNIVVGTLSGDISASGLQATNYDGTPLATAVSDLNQDGRLDLALVIPDQVNPTTAPGSVVILFNGGNTGQTWNGFTTSAVLNLGTSGVDPVDLAAGQFDGGAGNDLAVVSRTAGPSGTLQVLAQTGAGSFTLQPALALAGQPGGVCAGEFDASPGAGGRSDLAVTLNGPTPTADGQLVVVSNTGVNPGQVAFFFRPPLPVRPQPGRPRPFNPDNDKDTDIGVGGSSGTSVSLMLNQTTTPTSPAFDRREFEVGPGPVALDFARLDGNGSDDVVVAVRGSTDPLNTNSASAVAVILFDPLSPAGFRPPVNLPLGFGARSVAALDLSSDPQQNPDLALLARPTPTGDYRVLTLRNDRGTDPNPVFAPSQTIDPGLNAVLLARGNVDSAPSNDPQELIAITGSDPAARGGRGVQGQARPFRPTCRTDANADGVRSPADIFAFLTLYFNAATPLPQIDFNNDGLRTPADIFAFLTAYFGGAC
jgi:trimeric autotransporter adhesin